MKSLYEELGGTYRQVGDYFIPDMVAAMKKQQGITEELKARDQFAWVGAMSNIRNAAEEVILRELIYEEGA